MKAFNRITAPLLIMRENRIDTDILFPARFLLLMQRDGLGQYFCHDRRFDADGAAIDNEIDRAVSRNAGILVAGADFGCGSSREQAVWATTAAGFDCVIAESFGEIFAANCLRNGVLAIALPTNAIDGVVLMAAGGALTVDLAANLISGPAGKMAFSIPAAARERLLHGWDETAMIQSQWGPSIESFEQSQRRIQPWLYEEQPL